MTNFRSLKMVYVLIVFCIAIAVASSAQTLTTPVEFDGTNGAYSLYGYLIQGSDSNIYGTTTAGGTYNQGTIFELTPGGTLTTLYNFCNKTNCADGAAPYAPLVQGTDGDFYGTTSTGGAHGDGTVFKITSAGKLTTLHSFAGYPTDGQIPYAGLVESNGVFYGTTWVGGSNGLGTVFKMTPAGKVTIFYNFCAQADCTEGAFPRGVLVESGGNFYGTTSQGGSNNAGAVFEVTPAGVLTTLHTFSGSDGSTPYAGLVLAGGNFYGTTQGGGNRGAGTIFEMTPAGTLTTLHSFSVTDGAFPTAGVIQATDGNLYGTTQGGGAKNYGTVFKITLAGQLTTLHSFAFKDGSGPGGLVQAANGNIYGTTTWGGSRYDGTIFTLSLAKK